MHNPFNFEIQPTQPSTPPFLEGENEYDATNCKPFTPVSVENPGGGRIKNKKIPNSSDLVTVQGAYGKTTLHRLTAVALEALVCAARADGIKHPQLLPTGGFSGFRDPQRQHEAWERALIKYGSEKAANRWVAKPGFSAHQSGRAIDFYLGLQNGSSNVVRLRKTPAYKWMVANAHRFGFYPYSAEPWHWEYNPPASGQREIFAKDEAEIGKVAVPRDRDVGTTLAMAARKVPGLGITLEELLLRHKAEAGDIPIEVLLAFIRLEAGNHLFDDATAGYLDRESKEYKPEPKFYELGIFQTPAGDHGCLPDGPKGDRKKCKYEAPGHNVEKSQFGQGWYRLKRTYPNGDNWKDPIMQVRIGLWNLRSPGERVAREFPELFPSRRSEWYLRMAVLYSFAKGAGWTRAYLSKYKDDLLKRDENQRWDFLRGKQANYKHPVTKKIKTKIFDPENVDKKMALAAKLQAVRGATVTQSPAPMPGVISTARAPLQRELEMEGQPKRSPLPPKPSPPIQGHWLTPFTSSAIPKYKDRANKPQATTCSVYVPDAAWKQETIDLLVFFHGDPGPCLDKFNPDPKNKSKKFRLDAQIHSTGRKIALAVPVIHWIAGKSANILGAWSATNLNKFVEEVLVEIGKQSGVKPTLGRLIIAGHSHAYAILTPLACEFNQDAPATKTGALAKLDEVWALDSTYGQTHVRALEAWAHKLPTRRFIAVLNNGRGSSPLLSWTNYFSSKNNYCPAGFKPPANLYVCAVSEGHCDIPLKHIRPLLATPRSVMTCWHRG
jgi:LAS superfamily LD-carboxypeptidase LdcB